MSISLIIFFDFLFKKNKQKRKIRKWTIGLTIGFFIPITVLYLLFVVVSRFDRHYDVQKRTLLWYATMDNKTITQFPVIKPTKKAIYNSLGGDSPEIGAEWEIQYISEEEKTILSNEILNYLKKEGFKIKQVENPKNYWKENNKSIKSYLGSNKKGESLKLLLIEQNDNLIKVNCEIIL